MGVERRADGALILLPVTADRRAASQSRLEETRGLALALSLDVIGDQVFTLRRPSPSTYLGAGRVADVAELAEAEGVGLIIVDAALSPVQQRNLEKAWGAKVIDRTQLILEIFGLRAATREGRLQVELARLAYERSRLVRTWTHLERQRGGGGFLAGPGETQIEADRRMLDNRITLLRGHLDEVRRTRGVQRAGRTRGEWPVISLVGYTNAGKSTLFNRLSGAQVMAKDMLFATLDPTLRAIELPGGRKALLSDTVGFISDLPTDLVAAFRATLEEVAAADLLIHVRDWSDPEHDAHREDVETVLKQIGAGAEAGQIVIEAWNKIDALSPDDQEIAREQAQIAEPPAMPISAETGEGVEALMALVERALAGWAVTLSLRLSARDGDARAFLHRHGDVLEEAAQDDGGMLLTVRLPAAAAGRFRRDFQHLVPQDWTPEEPPLAEPLPSGPWRPDRD